jgi:hypothetical protein
MNDTAAARPSCSDLVREGCRAYVLEGIGLAMAALGSIEEEPFGPGRDDAMHEREPGAARIITAAARKRERRRQPRVDDTGEMKSGPAPRPTCRSPGPGRAPDGEAFGTRSLTQDSLQSPKSGDRGLREPARRHRPPRRTVQVRRPAG